MWQLRLQESASRLCTTSLRRRRGPQPHTFIWRSALCRPPSPRVAVSRAARSLCSQEVIMLQEKVANVAHGWLLKEESGPDNGKGIGTQFKHYWFVLFSNGILMYFSGPDRAVLGQALGFVPVEHCTE
eukprot:6191704-Pleurochrysis_carterae.AAC.1